MISEKKQVTWLHGHRKLLFCLINFGSVCGFCSWIPWERLHSLFRLLNNIRKFHRFFSWNSSFERILTHQPVLRMVSWSSSVRPSKKNEIMTICFSHYFSGPSGSLDNLSFIGEYMRINKHVQNSVFNMKRFETWKMTQIISNIVCVVSFVICCSL